VLRAKRTFKIGVKLALDGEGEPAAAPQGSAPSVAEPAVTPLTELEQRVIAVTQGHLPLEADAFGPWARELGLTEEVLVERLRELKARGVMRRFAAILHHRRAGFTANGMAAWAVAPEAVEAAGQTMAGFAAVSHCYERTLAPGWPYRLFSMIHGKSKEEVEATVAQLRARTGLDDVKVLYSSREFKKRRVELFPHVRSRGADAR
jgi:siroheme decarboxylase